MVMTVVDHLQKKVTEGEEGVVDHFQKVMEGEEQVVDHPQKMMVVGEEEVEEVVDHLHKKAMGGEGEKELQKKVLAEGEGEEVGVEAQASEVSNFSLLPKIRVNPGGEKRNKKIQFIDFTLKDLISIWLLKYN